MATVQKLPWFGAMQIKHPSEPLSVEISAGFSLDQAILRWSLRAINIFLKEWGLVQEIPQT